MRSSLAALLCLFALLLSAAPGRAQPPGPGAAGIAGAPASADPAYVPLAHQPTAAEVTAVMDRVLAYVDSATPAKLIDRQTQQEITDFTAVNLNAGFARDPS